VVTGRESAAGPPETYVTYRTLACLAAALVAACSSIPQHVLPPDGGNNQEAPPPEGPKETLTIDAATGVSLIQRPTRAEADRRISGPEAAVTGLVSVTSHLGDDSQAAPDAMLELNGVRIPAATGAMSGSGFFDLSMVKVPAVAGAPLTLKATRGAATTTLVIPCPDEVIITSPEDYFIVDPPVTITLSWTGRTVFPNAIFEPVAGLLEYTMADEAFKGAMDPKASASGNEVKLAIPEGYFRGYAAQVTVPGEFVSKPEGSGFCNLIRRVRVYTNDPR
jgi:hypothetical protein